MSTPGYQALREGAAILDLSARGRIRASGEDRKRLLHAMTTNHVQQLEPGQTIYAFFLNAQGRIQADVWIHAEEDFLLLDVEPEVREKVFAHLDKFIIADDVTLEDVTALTAEIAVEGPNAVAMPKRGVVLDASVTGQPAFRMVVPVEELAPLLQQLQAAGGVPASTEEVRAVRLENGVPRFGEDITDGNLVQESQQLQAVNFNKGCYLGQEIVERVRSRGQVNRLLTRLRIEGSTVPPAGEKVMAGDQEAGAVTSAAYSPAEGCVRALAYLRAKFIVPGAGLVVGGAAAEVVQQG
ncbi:glycine cleavage T C-terminal barrel domain-containing protein [uncultured Paludibaculum sp.]|uniref:CAF17-like 4Fe-4S cluster assembly/insertion protein YgfZ n=1 Tax=uncultured Paludibaculum sp. TaxID=1765020 RepID=UPI002AABA525|nr:glycine cleavage T C-terminal barrel domain-containing protein [uncultured Paludibaculum sp.]